VKVLRRALFFAICLLPFLTNSVFSQAPNISYSPSSNAYVVGTAITAWTPTNTGGSISSAYSSTSVSGPSGMAINPVSGNLYATQYTNGTVTYYSSSLTYVGALASGYTHPDGIAIDASGNSYVADPGSNDVYKITSGGVKTTLITGLNGPYGIGIDASGYLYVANTNSSQILKYANTGGSPLLTITSNVSEPTDVRVDASGNIYSLNFGTNNVTKYNSSGAYQSVFSSGYNGPYAIAISSAGNVYVGDSGNGKVDIYNSSGTLLNTITVTDPEGLVVGASGIIYVASYGGNTIYEYPPLGGYVLTGTLPTGLSFNTLTGTFSGTPTVSFASTSYTVTGYNASGNSSTSVTISCYSVYDWKGGTSTTWGTAGNWGGGVVPGPYDMARIGVSTSYTLTRMPVFTTGTNAVGSIEFGSGGGAAAGITVTSPAVLDVTGAIAYQSDAHSTNAYTATLAGTGTISAGSIAVTANTAISGSNYTQTLSSSVTTLNLSGNISLTSTYTSSKYSNATFNITGGTVALAGSLQTSNVTGSTSAFTVTNATLQLANATALSGLSTSGTNTVTFNNSGATIQYSAAGAQTVYTSAAITGLSSGVSYSNISFSGSGIKTATAGTLNVSGNYTNTLANDASDYVALTGSTVAFNGTTQSVAGGSGTGTKFYGLAFSGGGTKTLASGAFYLASAGTLTMSGSSTLATNGLITLNSDTTGTATVAAIPSGSSITGNVTVQRFVQGGSTYAAGRWVSRNYRLMSSQVNEGVDGNGNYPVSLNYLGAGTIITDCTSSYSTATGNPSLFLFYETYTPNRNSFIGGNFIGVTNIANTAATGHITTTDATYGSAKVYEGGGYMLYFRGDKVTHLSGSPSKTVAPYVAPESVTFSTTGNLNQGTISVVSWTGYAGLLYSTSNPGNAPVRGYNLVGNPYASSIDWSTFSNTVSTAAIYGPNVNPTIYLLDPTTSNYDTYNATTGISTGKASRIIPSGQGFFVESNNHSSALTFTENAKSATQVTSTNLELARRVAAGTEPQTGYGSFIRLNMVTDAINQTDMVVGFNPAATMAFNSAIDAKLLAGSGAPQDISTISSDNVHASVKWVPLPKSTASLIIPMGCSAAASGKYQILRTDLEAIPPLYDIWLLDSYAKDSLDIKNNASYGFNIDLSDTTSFGTNRFQLVIRENPTQMVRLLKFTAVKAAGGSQIAWVTQNESNYTKFALQRSTDGGTTYTVIDGLLSNSQGAYNYLDASPVAGANSYRLQITDLNGDITYSSVITIMYANSSSLVKTGLVVYPNPASTTLNLNIAPGFNPNQYALTAALSYNIQITNILGSVVRQTTTSTQTWQTDVSNLMPGTYTVKVVNNSNQSLVGSGTFIKL